MPEIVVIPYLDESDLSTEQTETYLGAAADGYLFFSATSREKVRTLTLTWTKLDSNKAQILVATAISAVKGNHRLSLPGQGIFIPKNDFLVEKWNVETADITMKILEVKA